MSKIYKEGCIDGCKGCGNLCPNNGLNMLVKKTIKIVIFSAEVIV